MDTFFWHWELATLCDLYCDSWFVSLSLLYVLNRFNDLVTLKDLAEDNVFTIEMSVTCLAIVDQLD